MAATIIGPMLLGVPLGLSFYDHLARSKAKGENKSRRKRLVDIVTERPALR
jgi:hypothetical protein